MPNACHIIQIMTRTNPKTIPAFLDLLKDPIYSEKRALEVTKLVSMGREGDVIVSLVHLQDELLFETRFPMERSFVYWVQFEYFKVSKELFLDFLDLALVRKFLTANERKSLVLVYESYFSEKVVEDEAGSD